MSELPKVFQNPINKKIKVQETFYSKDDSRDIKPNINEINRKINEIFSSNNHIYKSKVLITLDNRVINETIVGKTNNNLLTIDGKLININNINDIKKI